MTLHRPSIALPLGTRVELRIERLAAGGDGIARVDGCVIFVPKSAPGDVLLVEVTTRAKNHLRASIVEIRTPSPDRRAPLCAHFTRCGGCAWQHIRAEAQQSAKGEILRDALERQAGIHLAAPPHVHTAAEFGYRSRAELSIERTPSGGHLLGYRRESSHVVEPVSECPILVEPLQRELEHLRAHPDHIPARATRIHLAAGDARTSVAFVDANERTLRTAIEPAPIEIGIGDLRLEFGARGFFQGNARLIETLVGIVLDGARGREALDLYCGAGLFALPLSRHFERVVGLESDPDSIALARRNAARNGIANARFEPGDTLDYLQRARRVLEPDLVVLDPPRRGAGADVVAEIVQLAPREVRYVSCDPATLARDLALFLERGYELASIVALDMFPQTPHVESVAILRSRAPAG